MKRKFSILLIVILSFLIAPSAKAEGVSLYLSPQTGTFFVGGTFTVSIYVNTKGNEINVVEVDLRFPPEILQVTSPATGESFVSEWLSPPSYSNVWGKITFKGGIPGGIITSAGLISTITFRAKSPGLAKVEFLESSKVLLNDGRGTPVFATTIGGLYEILIPPPEGPSISSPTHPDSDIWYRDNNPSFSWEKGEGIGDELRSSSPFASARVTDFSFSLSQNPQEEPDTISEGDINFKSYTEVSDGIWYFHLRAKKGGVWGKTSHAVIKIDTAPPLEFTPRVDTYSRFVYFETKDIHSGVDYFELSVRETGEALSQQPFFTEAVSPFKIPYEKPGRYSVVVRAFDKAGNWREEEVKFRLINPTFAYIEGKGIQFRGILVSWWVIYIIGLALIFGIGYLIFYLSLKRRLEFRKGIKEIEEALTEIRKIEEREKELRRLREKFEEEKEKLEEKLKP